MRIVNLGKIKVPVNANQSPIYCIGFTKIILVSSTGIGHKVRME